MKSIDKYRNTHDLVIQEKPVIAKTWHATCDMRHLIFFVLQTYVLAEPRYEQVKHRAELKVKITVDLILT